MDGKIKQELSNIQAEMDNLLIRESKKEPIDDIKDVIARVKSSLSAVSSGTLQALEKIEAERVETKDKVELLAATYKQNVSAIQTQYENKISEMSQKHQINLESSTKAAHEAAYNNAYENIGGEFIRKTRCVKCGNNKIAIKHDYRADVLGCNCTICGFEWDKDCLDKKQ